MLANKMYVIAAEGRVDRGKGLLLVNMKDAICA